MKRILVTYATGRFRFRQALLVTSARANRVVDESITWSTGGLANAGFYAANPGILSSERGAGFWSWKPYVILRALEASSAGDWIIYSDVGRFDVRLLRTSVDPFITWASRQGQDCLPGVHIPWYGPMEKWTKADAFHLLGCEEERFRSADPIQASFSAWKNTEWSRKFVSEWYDRCKDRRLVSDDANTCGIPNSPNFVEHRHDQSILSLLCLRAGVKGLTPKDGQPSKFEDRSIEPWLVEMGAPAPSGTMNRIFEWTASLYKAIEKPFR